MRRNGFCPAKVVEGIFPAAFVQRKQTAHEIEVWREVESAPFLFFGHGFLKSIQDRFRLRRPAKRAVAGDQLQGRTHPRGAEFVHGFQ